MHLAATPLPEGFSLGKTRVTVRFWAGGRGWAQPLVCSLQNFVNYADFYSLRYLYLVVSSIKTFLPIQIQISLQNVKQEEAN